MSKKPTQTELYDLHNHSILINNREIFIHGCFDSDEDGANTDFRSANIFLKNLRLLESISSSPILIHQHNDGGDWYSGMLMYDALLFCKSPILFLSYGIAASMGSIIPQAIYGKGLRVSMPNCEWLIHEGYNSFDGTQKQTYAYSVHSEKLKKKIYEIYAGVCSGAPYFVDSSLTKIKSFLKRKLESKEDWWISAEEAHYYGFCDGIYGQDGFEDLTTIKGKL